MSGSNRLPYEQAAISVAVVRRRHRFRPFAGVRNSAEGPPASNNDARPQLRQAGESGVSGCPVWTAATSAGRNSRDSSGARRGEVIFCDIGLPGLDGSEAGRAIRSEDGVNRSFLVALSGYAMPEELQRAADAASSDICRSR